MVRIDFSVVTFRRRQKTKTPPEKKRKNRRGTKKGADKSRNKDTEKERNSGRERQVQESQAVRGLRDIGV